MSRCFRVGCLSVIVLAASVAISAEPSSPQKNGEPVAVKKAAEPAKPAPASHTVAKSPLKITVELDGILEGAASCPIVVKPKEWTALTVLSAAPHGARVNKGDVLIKIDTEKLDRAIADLRAELNIAEVAVQQNQEQVKVLEKLVPLELEANERASRIAEEDREYFFNIDRPFTLKAMDFSLKMAQESLEYQKEELDQLEKMYKADDITEETEAIVLKRGRDAVERAKFSLEVTKFYHDQQMKFGVPRKDEQIKEATRRKLLDVEKNKALVPLALQKVRLELEKQQTQRAVAQEKLKRLEADRELMTVVSPADGIVYYGKMVRGKPGDSTALADAFSGLGAIPANQIVMMVVEPRPMRVRVTVPENRLSELRPGLKGTATPTAYPDLRLPATIDSLGNVPIAPGAFDATLSVSLEGKDQGLVPGMTCKVKLVPYLNQNAITVPPKAVVTDDLDEEKQSVQVLAEDGKTSERRVVVGRKTDKQVEILEGLSEGEKVLLEPAKNSK